MGTAVLVTTIGCALVLERITIVFPEEEVKGNLPIWTQTTKNPDKGFCFSLLYTKLKNVLYIHEVYL